MISYGRQLIDRHDIEAVEKVLYSDYLTQGPQVLKFEKKLAQYCGAKFAVACANGTAALHLAYLVAGLKPGDEVITTPNTFVATTNMILAVGAKPVFCDIRNDTYNIDENKIKNLITKKTRAIVPVHFAGQPCEMKKIRQTAKKYKLLVIEDACHALGAKYQGKKIGSCRYSDIAVFSFHAVKPITTGEGGAIFTNNTKFYSQLISLRSHGIHKDKNGKNVMTALGYNYRLTDIQASLGLSQLTKLDKFIKQRRQIAQQYQKLLSGEKNIILPQEAAGNYSGWHLYVIRTVRSKDRDLLSSYLKKQGIGVNFHYPAVYYHPYYRERGYRGLKLKQTEIYANSCLTLPLHAALSKKDVIYVSNKIRDYYVS